MAASGTSSPTLDSHLNFTIHSTLIHSRPKAILFIIIHHFLSFFFYNSLYTYILQLTA